jgi:hypothetical protein
LKFGFQRVYLPFGRGQGTAKINFCQFENVPPEHFQGILFWAVSREGGLVRPPSKSCRFSHPPLRVPKYGTGCFVACGRRQGLLALDLGSIFEKLLHQKTFNFVAAEIDSCVIIWIPKGESAL